MSDNQIENDPEFAEIDAMKAIAVAMKGLPDDAIGRVLNWAGTKYGVSISPAKPSSNADEPAAPSGQSDAKPKPKSSKPTKKSKSVMKMIKDLNLHPADKQTAEDFASEKSPSNHKQRSVVAVYYMRDVLEISEISADHVYTYFKTVGWQVPADLKNVMQQAGTEGWLDTSNSSNIVLTTSGENLVEHTLANK